MSEVPELGKLQKVEVRDVWKNEAANFTPWLSENLDRLTAKLGVELELVEKEKQVGALRADIVARIPDHGGYVLIENQLEQSDLKHLGQILSYLAGLEAQLVVWIAPSFRNDHLNAIRWLNQNTADPFAFFALKLSAFRIECSPYAPEFETLEKPAEWRQMVKSIHKSVERPTFQRDFWSHCRGRWPVSLGLERGYAKSRYRRWIEEADLKIALYLRKDVVRVYVTGNSDEADEDVFSRINCYRDSLDCALEGSTFIRGDNPRCTTELPLDTRDRNNWDEMADWLYSQERKYEEVLRGGLSEEN